MPEPGAGLSCSGICGTETLIACLSVILHVTGIHAHLLRNGLWSHVFIYFLWNRLLVYPIFKISDLQVSVLFRDLYMPECVDLLFMELHRRHLLNYYYLLNWYFDDGILAPQLVLKSQYSLKLKVYTGLTSSLCLAHFNDVVTSVPGTIYCRAEASPLSCTYSEI